VSLEGYVSANVLIQALKRTGPQLDTERLIDVLENMRNLDLGLGAQLSWTPGHPGFAQDLGTALDKEPGNTRPELRLTARISRPERAVAVLLR
jgi:hypothetical protein